MSRPRVSLTVGDARPLELALEGLDLAWYDLDEQHGAADDVLRAFEDGFSRGVEVEAVRSATAFLP